MIYSSTAIRAGYLIILYIDENLAIIFLQSQTEAMNQSNLHPTSGWFDIVKIFLYLTIFDLFIYSFHER